MLACVRGGKAAKGNKIYPYLLPGLRVDRPNQVWCADITDLPPLGRFALQIACRAMDAARFPLSGGDPLPGSGLLANHERSGLAHAQGSGMAHLKHAPSR